jgi:hypothetical protein
MTHGHAYNLKKRPAQGMALLQVGPSGGSSYTFNLTLPQRQAGWLLAL